MWNILRGRLFFDSGSLFGKCCLHAGQEALGDGRERALFSPDEVQFRLQPRRQRPKGQPARWRRVDETVEREQTAQTFAHEDGRVVGETERALQRQFGVPFPAPPGASHTGLCGNLEKIPFDAIEEFFKNNLK